MTVWVVRAGEHLKFLPDFETQSVVGIGWSELPVPPIGMSRTELADAIAQTYPGASAATRANYVGQVWHFVNTMALGDLVLVPLKASSALPRWPGHWPGRTSSRTAHPDRRPAGGVGD